MSNQEKQLYSMDSYLQKRQLKGNAGWLLLWGLGVGAVISGDFFGWNFGLGVGGFWGLAIATILMAIMYICMILSISELSTALPFAGGFYGFTRLAFGPFWGYVCGITMLIEYVLTPAVIVVGASTYLKQLFPDAPFILLWAVLYSIFVGINLLDVMVTFYVGLFITVAAILVLIIFYLSITFAGSFNPELLFTIPPDAGQLATWLPKGFKGIFDALPYAIWFFLAIEELPLAAEETRQVNKNMPLGLIWGIITLIVLAGFTLVINTGVGKGAIDVATSAVPIAYGFDTFFGKGATSNFITTIAITCGMIASFHTIIYASGRSLFALSRAGYIPRWLSVTNTNRVPARALILGGIFGFICTVIVDLANTSKIEVVGAVLLNMSVFGAVISYTLVMLSYIKLKLSLPKLKRPFQSPLGIIGAGVGAFLAVIALFACFSVPAYQPAIYAVSVFLFLAIAYFLLYSRYHLVAQAPEEKVPMLIAQQLMSKKTN
jgi:ethanolamine permease